MTDVIDALVQQLWPERHVTVQPLLGASPTPTTSWSSVMSVVRIPGDNTALLGH
ncbi:MAG TPA: hypothetical protein VNF08_04335 [Acidimicrobiales bacterium]|nr:hypothetical protein [Acidimicrobiales bacterium]